MRKIRNQLFLFSSLKGISRKGFFCYESCQLLGSDPVGTEHSAQISALCVEKLIKQSRRHVGLNRKVSFNPNEYPTASLCGLGSIKKTGGVENQPRLKKERGERGSRVTAIPGCLNYSAIISFSECRRDKENWDALCNEIWHLRNLCCFCELKARYQNCMFFWISPF